MSLQFILLLFVLVLEAGFVSDFPLFRPGEKAANIAERCFHTSTTSVARLGCSKVFRCPDDEMCVFLHVCPFRTSIFISADTFSVQMFTFQHKFHFRVIFWRIDKFRALETTRLLFRSLQAQLFGYSRKYFSISVQFGWKFSALGKAIFVLLLVAARFEICFPPLP